MHAVVVGYVEYPVIGLESGLAPVSDLLPATSNLTAHSNTTNAFVACPEAGTGPSGVVYAGLLVSNPCCSCHNMLMPDYQTAHACEGFYIQSWPANQLLYRSMPAQCDAVNGNVTVTTWKVRCSFPVYLIAMAATAGAAHVCMAFSTRVGANLRFDCEAQ